MGTLVLFIWFVAWLDTEWIPVAPVIPVMTLMLSSSSTAPVMMRLLFVPALGFFPFAPFPFRCRFCGCF